MIRQATLKQLRAAARTAETGNVTAAAQSLHRSPPAASTAPPKRW